jgi:hypothetical protein
MGNRSKRLNGANVCGVRHRSYSDFLFGGMLLQGERKTVRKRFIEHRCQLPDDHAGMHRCDGYSWIATRENEIRRALKQLGRELEAWGANT